MFHHTTRGAGRFSNVKRPFPSGFITGTANRDAAEVDQFEFTFLEVPHFIGMLKALQNYFVHDFAPSVPRDRFTSSCQKQKAATLVAAFRVEQFLMTPTATAVAAMSTATVAPASSTTAARAPARPSASPATVSAAIGTITGRAGDVLWRCFPVEIRLVTFSEISSAF